MSVALLRHARPPGPRFLKMQLDARPPRRRSCSGVRNVFAILTIAVVVRRGRAFVVLFAMRVLRRG
jgi:hypothetical protein